MNQIYIVCIDDEPDVLEAVERDLATMESRFPLETASSAHEAREIIQRIAKARDEVGVVFCDHIMPRETGVEFMRWLVVNSPWPAIRKALLTGQAGLEATIAAVNEGQLDYYVAKPWTRETLLGVAKNLLTDYVIATEKDPLRFMEVLDAARLSEAMRARRYYADT